MISPPVAPPPAPPLTAQEAQCGVLLMGSLVQVLYLPIWVLRSPDFIALRRKSPLALRVLLCLWAHGRGVGSVCFPGERRLAALCKTSVPSVSTAIKLLERLQWILVERQKFRGQGNRYTLRLHDGLAITHAHATAWLDRPTTGQDAPPVEDPILQRGDLWGKAGKGRRRARHARVEAAAMNSATWDGLWRENALAGHLWLLLQAYEASGEQLSLSRLARELDARTSAICAALRLLRQHGMLIASTIGPHGTRHAVAAPTPESTLRLSGALAHPGKGRSRRAVERDTDGRWRSQGGHRPRRTLTAPAKPRLKPGNVAKPRPIVPSAPVALSRWCVKHGGTHGLMGDLRYGGQLQCGCLWTPDDDSIPDPRRPADYRAA